jgi:crossover junction endodeoxyribonuclease RusA
VTGNSDPRRLLIELPPDLPLLNANDRIHYRSRARITKEIRSAAKEAVQHVPFTRFGEVKVRCIFRAPDNRRRDVSNLYPSFKCALDGLVDAGLLKDDSDRYVKEFTIIRGENLSKRSQLIIEVEELCDSAGERAAA